MTGALANGSRCGIGMAKELGQIAEANKRPHLRVLDREGVPLRERSSETLMLEHGRGSEEAFEELVRRHQRGVLNFLYRMVQNRHIAEELTQEVFVALVKSAERYEPTANSRRTCTALRRTSRRRNGRGQSGVPGFSACRRLGAARRTRARTCRCFRIVSKMSRHRLLRRFSVVRCRRR